MYDGPIVCDSGPLIALSMVARLDLLPELFSRVVAPAAVLREIVESGAGRLGAREVEGATWLEQVDDEVLPEPLLALEVGPGEAAVIAVASRLGAPLVLVDELRARRIAERAYGLRVKGSAGVLVAAKRAGLIRAVRPLLESMAEQGYFLSRRLIERAFREAGESSSEETEP